MSAIKFWNRIRYRTDGISKSHTDPILARDRCFAPARVRYDYVFALRQCTVAKEQVIYGGYQTEQDKRKAGHAASRVRTPSARTVQDYRTPRQKSVHRLGSARRSGKHLADQWPLLAPLRGEWHLVADSLSPEERSERMSRIRSKNMRPEMLVRRFVFAMGYRYRLHARDLPGCPDLVFRPRRKVIFVHGCFWHCHANCPIARIPKSRVDFWEAKLEGNRQRDEKNKRKLARQGWGVLTLWECELKDTARLERRIRRFLDA